MFCPVCGCEMKETDKVCLACGQPNENYVAPEGAEEAAEEVAAAVVTEVETPVEAVEAAEAAPVAEEAVAKGKKDIAKPIVALSLAGLAFCGAWSYTSALVSLVMAIVARVLAKPYKDVKEKPVSIFYKVTNIVSLVAVIISAVMLALFVLWTVSYVILQIFGFLFGGLTMFGLGGMYYGDMFDFTYLIERIIAAILEAIGLY